MSQIGLPTEVAEREIVQAKSFCKALELCAGAAGYDLDKELQQELGVDKGHFSRIKNGTEGLKIDKFFHIMDFCGNDAPLMWLAHQRGYDIGLMRKRESETEIRLRKEQERADAAEAELKILRKYVSGLRPGE